jgi:hypothetical protein
MKRKSSFQLLFLILVLLAISSGCSFTVDFDPATTTPVPTKTATETALPTITPMATQEPSPILMENNFNDGSSCFVETPDNGLKHIDGKLEISAVGNNQYIVATCIRELFSDFHLSVEISTDVSPNGEATFEIMFRSHMGNQQYRFVIEQLGNGDIYYSILRVTEEGFISIAPDSYGKTTNYGLLLDIGDFHYGAVNLIEIIAHESTLVFFINNTYLVEVDDSQYSTGLIEFVVGTFSAEYAVMTIDNIIVKRWPTE